MLQTTSAHACPVVSMVVVESHGRKHPILNESVQPMGSIESKGEYRTDLYALFLEVQSTEKLVAFETLVAHVDG